MNPVVLVFVLEYVFAQWQITAPLLTINFFFEVSHPILCRILEQLILLHTLHHHGPNFRSVFGRGLEVFEWLFDFSPQHDFGRNDGGSFHSVQILQSRDVQILLKLYVTNTCDEFYQPSPSCISISLNQFLLFIHILFKQQIGFCSCISFSLILKFVFICQPMDLIQLIPLFFIFGQG